MAYLAGRAILKKEFEFLKFLVKWMSSSLYAWGVAVAVILSLNIISLSIAGIDITLKNASLETIIALSFILGFYNEEARALLSSLRRRFASNLDESNKQPRDKTE